MKHPVFLSALLLAVSAQAEVVFDGSVNPDYAGVRLDGDFTVSDGQGALRGNNLFHSFQTFNVQPGESATFSGPNHVENIIGRVTGGSYSGIWGPVKTAPELKAHLFLLNPYGFMLGSGATLDVNGAVYLSMADYLRFSDGRFAAK